MNQQPNIIELEATIMFATKAMKDCIKKVVKTNFETSSEQELKELDNCTSKWSAAFTLMGQKDEGN